MNRPDKAGEPSMEEILASIRQTIAAEQDGTSAPVDRSAPGNFSRINGAPRPVTAPADRGPPLGRLTEALRQHAPPPSNGLGSKRPSSFDDDLADILAEPAGQNGIKVTAPKPTISIAPDVPGFLAPRMTEAKAAAAPQPQTFTAPSSAPVPSSTPVPSSASAPVSAQPQPAPEPTAPPPKTPFPMRRAGFYPPAGYTPTLPPLSPLPESPSGADPVRSESAAGAPRHSDSMVKRLAGLGGVVPASPHATPAEHAPAAEAEKPVVAAEPVPFTAPVSEPQPQLGPAPGAQAGSQPAAEPEPKLAPVSEGPRPVPLVRGLAESIAAAAASVPETPAVSIVEEPVEAPAPEPELIIETIIAEVLAEPEVVQVLEEVSVQILEPEPVETFASVPVETVVPEPEPVEKPAAAPSSNGTPYNGAQHNGVHYNGAQFNGAQYNGTQHNGAHYNGSASAPAAPRMSAPSQPVAPPASAAKLALDALAQGLAAAASHPMNQQPSPAPAPHRPDPYAHSTGTLVPVVESDMRQYPDAGQRMPVYPPYDPHQSVRTLEDAVADMLKPLLQQWLADNMPRIIEKALRVEAASAVKKGHKPPGT